MASPGGRATALIKTLHLVADEFPTAMDGLWLPAAFMLSGTFLCLLAAPPLTRTKAQFTPSKRKAWHLQGMGTSEPNTGDSVNTANQRMSAANCFRVFLSGVLSFRLFAGEVLSAALRTLWIASKKTPLWPSCPNALTAVGCSRGFGFIGTSRRRFPPGPWSSPVLGHLPSLSRSQEPHRLLADMAARYGPILGLWVGSTRTVVVSSPETAREVLRAADLACSSRPPLLTWRLLSYGCRDLALAPRGPGHAQARRLATVHLFSAKRMEAWKGVREEEAAALVSAVAEESAATASGTVVLRPHIARTSLNNVMRMVCGKRYAFNKPGKADVSADEVTSVILKVAGLLGPFNYVDHIPGWQIVEERILKHGTSAKCRQLAPKLRAFFTSLLEDHRRRRNRAAGSNSGMEPPKAKAEATQPVPDTANAGAYIPTELPSRRSSKFHELPGEAERDFTDVLLSIQETGGSEFLWEKVGVLPECSPTGEPRSSSPPASVVGARCTALCEQTEELLSSGSPPEAGLLATGGRQGLLDCVPTQSVRAAELPVVAPSLASTRVEEGAEGEKLWEVQGGTGSARSPRGLDLSRGGGCSTGDAGRAGGCAGGERNHPASRTQAPTEGEGGAGEGGRRRAEEGGGLRVGPGPPGDAGMSDEEVMALLQDMVVAGTDTSAATVEWAIAELIRSPAAQQRLQAELDAAIASAPAAGESQAAAGGLEDNKGELRWESVLNLMELPYLQAVVKETLRLHPPGTLLMPHYAEEECCLGGGEYRVPAGTMVLVNAWAINRSPDVWRDPHSFVPERFLEASYGTEGTDMKGQDFRLLPFGSGRRGCVGLRLGHALVTLMLARLLHAFRWEAADAAGPDTSVQYGLASRMAVPLMARVERRQRKD